MYRAAAAAVGCHLPSTDQSIGPANESVAPEAATAAALDLAHDGEA